MDISKAIHDYDRLLQRALEIMDSPPYWKFVDIEGSVAVLVLDPDRPSEVGIRWNEAVTEWDVADLRHFEQWFPAELLTMPKTEFEAWKAEQVRLQQERETRRREEEKRREDASERQQYLTLKAKYEPE